MDKRDKLYELIGENIIQLRSSGEKKISQQKIADHLDMSRTSIVNIEAGRQKVSLFALWEIAELFDKDISHLLPTREDLERYINPLTDEDKIRSAVKDKKTQLHLINIVNSIKNKPTQ